MYSSVSNIWLMNCREASKYPFFLVVDADEKLPRTFAHSLLSAINADSFAFVQAAHSGRADTATCIQRLCNLQVDCIWFYEVPARQVMGIAPIPEIDDAIRRAVRALETGDAHGALLVEDPAMAAALNPRDDSRIKRALEVVRSTGRSIGEWREPSSVAARQRAVLGGAHPKP